MSTRLELERRRGPFDVTPRCQWCGEWVDVEDPAVRYDFIPDSECGPECHTWTCADCRAAENAGECCGEEED